MVNIKQPEFDGKYKSEWNMATYDFSRFHTLFCLADQFNIELLMNKNKIKEMFSVIETIYANMRPLLFDKSPVQKEIDEMSDNIRDKLNLYSRVSKNGRNNKLISEISELEIKMYRELLNIKQLVGLGIPIRKTWNIGVSRRKVLSGEA